MNKSALQIAAESHAMALPYVAFWFARRRCPEARKTARAWIGMARSNRWAVAA